jgi:hypothetical protein
MPNQTTHLASGTLNGHDQLIVELVESEDAAKHLPVIAIRWPSKATVTTPAAYDQVAANVMQRRPGGLSAFPLQAAFSA